MEDNYSRLDLDVKDYTYADYNRWIDLIIDPREWSQSTWEEMIHFLGISVVRENKISLDLRQYLEDKLK